MDLMAFSWAKLIARFYFFGKKIEESASPLLPFECRNQMNCFFRYLDLKRERKKERKGGFEWCGFGQSTFLRLIFAECVQRAVSVRAFQTR
jgi:hypothetical protein